QPRNPMMRKTFVVTGANNGIGLETSRALAAQGHQVILVTRTREKGEAARENILQTHPEAGIDIAAGELSLLRDIRRVGAEITDRYPVIDGLINNVGTWMSRHVLTDEGIETVF